MKLPVNPTMLTLSKLIDEDKCYETIRTMRWPEGVCCIGCGSKSITKRGKHNTSSARQRYVCGECGRHFDDLTDIIPHSAPAECGINLIWMDNLSS